MTRTATRTATRTPTHAATTVARRRATLRLRRRAPWPLPWRVRPLLAALTAALLLVGAARAQPAPPAPAAPAPAAPAPAAAAPAAPASTAAPAAGSDVEISARAYAIAKELRCPVCTAESVADSNAEIAGEMRRLIQQQLDAGKSKEQIVGYFRQRYGDWILLDPPKTGLHLVVWLLPLLALLGGAAALALLVRRWRAAAETTPDAPDEDLQRVRAALRAREDDA